MTFCTGDMGNTFRLEREVLMPWRQTSVMEERLRFVARLLEGEGMSDVCREFGISRKTGYKIGRTFGSGLSIGPLIAGLSQAFVACCRLRDRTTPGLSCASPYRRRNELPKSGAASKASLRRPSGRRSMLVEYGRRLPHSLETIRRDASRHLSAAPSEPLR